MIKYAIALAVLLTIAAFLSWAFLPARYLPGNRVSYLRLRLRLRLHPGKGFAGIAGLWLRWGRVAVWRRSRRIRPSLSVWQRLRAPGEHSVFLGRAQWRHRLRVPLEEHVLVMAPPRTFKTAFLADVILRYPGPVISTTTKADVYGLTAESPDQHWWPSSGTPQARPAVPSAAGRAAYFPPTLFARSPGSGIAVIGTKGSTLMRIIHRLGKELLKILRTRVKRSSILASCAAMTIAGLALPAGIGGHATAAALPVPEPTFSGAQWLTGSTTPPTQAQCASAVPVHRRCFNPASMENSYNLLPLYAAGNQGQGVTVAIIDSFGNPNMASDLANFDTQFGLPHMCGEPGASCAAGAPTFTHVFWDGNTQVKAPPPGSKAPGLEDRNAWALETSLDVEWVHAIAPKANILNVTTDTAETLGVQGFPAMMKAEQFIVDHHQATVISQSFGSAEEAFNSTQSLQNLRFAFTDAAAHGVTVLASSGDGGSGNPPKSPVGGGGASDFPFPTVGWPASDPLVTAVGGTYLCTNPVTGTSVDSADPPTTCQTHPGVREVGWIDSGGGFSHVFAKPSYQDALPAGSTPITSGRGVPDVAYQASSQTGVLVYDTAPGDATGGVLCPPANPCSAGWYVVGGTSSSSPQFGGIVAIADQIARHGLGQINPTLYKLASGPNYGTYFYDVTTGNNGAAAPTVPGFPATTGWDPVTGLGTPNAAALVPALAAG